MKILQFKKKTFDVIAYAKRKLAEQNIEVGKYSGEKYDFCNKCNQELIGWYLYCPKCGKKTGAQQHK
jgi:hypothetical protein